MTVWTYTWMVTTIPDEEAAQEKLSELAAAGLDLRDLSDTEDELDEEEDEESAEDDLADEEDADLEDEEGDDELDEENEDDLVNKPTAAWLPIFCTRRPQNA